MQDHPSESFVARFESLAGTSTKRRVDLELRFLDVLFALVFWLLALPFALVLAAVVAVSSGFPVLSRGAVLAWAVCSGLPVLCRSERAGGGGGVFGIYKFRPPSPDAETRLGPYLGEELVR